MIIKMKYIPTYVMYGYNWKVWTYFSHIIQVSTAAILMQEAWIIQKNAGPKSINIEKWFDPHSSYLSLNEMKICLVIEICWACQEVTGGDAML